MVQEYLTVAEISRRIGTDYYNTRKMLLRLHEQNEVKKVDNRYEFNDFITKHFNQKEHIQDVLKETTWIDINATHQQLAEHNIQMHIKTVGRKVKEGKIPAIIIPNKKRSLYRIPKQLLLRQINDGIQF